MMAHPCPLRGARALLDKSVVKKFPMFTNSYPNRGAGGRAPIIGFGRRFFGVGLVHIMSDYANCFHLLGGFYLGF
jgi:hypothetical protein